MSRRTPVGGKGPALLSPVTTPAARVRSQRWVPYALLAPSVIFLLLLFAWPLIEAVLLSVRGTTGSLTTENFQRMADDLNFRDALRNTLLLTVIVVPLQAALALGLASLVSGMERGRNTLLYVLTIPLGISDIAAGIAWLAIFTERGYLNSMLMSAGAIEQPLTFLSYDSLTTLLLAVILAELWRATAIMLVILVAGMQLIPRMYAEAADVFGATPWQRFTKITLPLLKPSLQNALILRTIAALEVFAVVSALGGRNLPVLAGEAYNWYGTYQNASVAAAYGVLIMAISLLLTFAYLKLIRVKPEATV
ncbi:carbohydrate ABC transporter permease [Deinococcus peraridilitoris]|uniref:Permease component of ABC-type sugar transporter n=1 Tax=Deinococcus peraridilitoris (strain DSM 19664 / LMG 22246 / CIP 109416 / KR-200) TaxID=937777 RepID=L0A7E6_DEIPD|nr:sugar ABC transporter permease [Deinococcus peraridilitoris]AFZ69736.1 permease component of ABC-type sugar transporter [Deinococcus peraridilitoris DSM 19664]